MEGTSKKKGSNFWGTLPGIITAVAGLITALGSCIAVIVAWPRPNVIFRAVPTPIIITAQPIDLEDNSTAPQAPTTAPQAAAQPTSNPAYFYPNNCDPAHTCTTDRGSSHTNSANANSLTDYC